MKKFIRIMLIILLLCFGTVCAYTGWQFFTLYNTDSTLKKDIKETSEKMDDADKQISDLNKEIESLSKDNDLYTEYQNWQRQNRKLEEILARQ